MKKTHKHIQLPTLVWFSETNSYISVIIMPSFSTLKPLEIQISSKLFMLNRINDPAKL